MPIRVLILKMDSWKGLNYALSGIVISSSLYIMYTSIGEFFSLWQFRFSH